MEEFFKEYFKPIPIRFSLEFFFGFAGLVLSIISLFPKTKKKKIEIEQADNDSTIFLPGKYRSYLQVLYNDKKCRELFLLTLFIKNSGGTVLKKDDFHKPCKVKFGSDINFQNVELSSNDEFSKSRLAVNQEDLEVDIELLEPDVFLKLEVLYESDVLVETKFESNLIGGERLRSDLSSHNRIEHYAGEAKDANAWPMAVFIVGSIIFALEVFTIEHLLGIEVFDKNLKVILPRGWFALFFILPAYAAYRLFLILIVKRRPWSKIKNWFQLTEFVNS